MTYEWREHTAEIELVIESRDRAGVFGAAMRALAELAGSGEGDVVEREIQLEERDLPSLLVAWMEELVYVAETEGLVAEEADVSLRSGARLRAKIRGRLGRPRPLVKAITYHNLEFQQRDGRWAARVVLDV